MEIVTAFEGFLYKTKEFSDLEKLKIDQVLMLGVGTWADNLGSRITWWAIKKEIPIVHLMGNYDSLCSKGFRGHPVDHLLDLLLGHPVDVLEAPVGD